MSQPRPKPWEVSSGTSSASVGAGQPTQIGASSSASPISNSATLESTSTVSLPELPSKPTSLSSDNANLSSTSSYSPYGTRSAYNSGYGSSAYGMGSYGSSYGMGGYGSSYGMGGYGGSYGMGGYGGYGSRYGMGGYGGSYGMGGGPMNNNMNGFTQSTELTFQLIESIIGAVGGFAQMLELTYMLTHSSFFTMISVLEQFGHLKNALGSLLGIFTFLTWIRKLLLKLTGNKDYLKINAKEFKKFELKQLASTTATVGKQASNRISLKPLMLFVAAVFGFPYILKKLITHLSMIQQQQQQRLPQQQLDPTSLEFARAMYDFNPEDKSVELELKKNDLVAILTKLDPVSGQESKWWKCRSRDGRIGFVPYNFLQLIKRDAKKLPPSAQELGDQTLVSSPSLLLSPLVEEFKNLATK